MQILNTLGLLSAVIGTAIVWKYGLPALEVIEEGLYSEIKITDTMRKYTKLSRIGLALIGAGFALQLLAALAP